MDTSRWARLRPKVAYRFRIRSGVRPGDYRIRLDQMSASDSVASRVEMPFRAPAIGGCAGAFGACANAGIARRSGTRLSRHASPSARQRLRHRSRHRRKRLWWRTTRLLHHRQRRHNRSLLRPDRRREHLASGPAPRSRCRTAPASTVPCCESLGSTYRRPCSAAERKERCAQQASQMRNRRAPWTEPKVASNTSPRIAGPAKDRDDAVIIPRIDTRLIVRGDNLWRISEATYGLGKRYTVIFGANRDKIRDPDLIYPVRFSCCRSPAQNTIQDGELTRACWLVGRSVCA